MEQAFLEKQAVDLLTAIRPWVDQEEAFLVDLAKQQWPARLAIASALHEAGQSTEAALLLESVIRAPEVEDPQQMQAKWNALVELAHLQMDQLHYDEAEDLLWQARERIVPDPGEPLQREDVSLLIAGCRFGQGFVQEAIDRAEEIVRKLLGAKASGDRLAKAYQQLGWFYLHKTEVSSAMTHMKKAMELAPALDRQLVDAAIEAEQAGDFEKAVACYFDAILFD